MPAPLNGARPLTGPALPRLADDTLGKEEETGKEESCFWEAGAVAG